MIQSRPQARSKGTVITALVLLVLSVTALMFSSAFGKYCSAVQFAGFLMAAYSLYIVIKYVITDYLYTLEDSHLTVHKITKSQSVCVADVEIGDITNISCKLNGGAPAKKGKICTFIKNPKSTDICTIEFNIAGSDYTLVIEPDETFLKELLAEYQYVKNNNFNKEEEND